MLPRLPKRLLQRSIQLPKRSNGVAGGTVAFSTCPMNERDLRFSSLFRTTKTSSLLHCSCNQEILFNLSCVRNVYRFKSTKPKETSTEEGELEDNVRDKKEDVTEEYSLQETSDRGLEKRKSPKDDKIVVTRSPEEEEKSRRRYEKPDPPEEERHSYWKKRPDRSINKALMRTDFFDHMGNKNKETFAYAVELFKNYDVHLRGHVEFIYVALREMKKFGVHRDLETYKKIIDIFPKGKMIQTNMFQQEFMHYPKHQQCAVDILEQMEDYGVQPDIEIQVMLTNIFGKWSFPMRKASRMLYWMPKFKYLNPWPIPDPLPDSALELAKLAVARMTSVDLTTTITVYDCADLDDAYDMTWIVSGQSPEQQNLIEKLPTDRPIYVEGAFRVWLRHTCMNYFLLRADPKPPPPTPTKEEIDDVSNLHTIVEEEFIDTALVPTPTVHEQEDGVILGVCCTGTSSRDSLVSWIRFLEKSNPRLGKDISVLFTLKSPIGPTDDIEVLSYRDLEELKQIGKPRDPFLTSPSSESLDFDPAMPDLRQVGIWSESETQFPNWPHHFHKPDSVSMKNKLENAKVLDEIEAAEQKKAFREKIGSHDDSSKKDVDQIKQIEKE